MNTASPRPELFETWSGMVAGTAASAAGAVTVAANPAAVIPSAAINASAFGLTSTCTSSGGSPLSRLRALSESRDRVTPVNVRRVEHDSRDGCGLLWPWWAGNVHRQQSGQRRRAGRPASARLHESASTALSQDTATLTRSDERRSEAGNRVYADGADRTTVRAVGPL